MQRDGTLLLGGHHLRLLLQATDDTVNGIEEVLLPYHLRVVTRCYQRCLVTHVGDVGTGETRCLAGQQLDVHALVNLDRSEVHLEYLLAFGQVGQVYVYLSVKAACTEQRLVEHVHTVGGSEDDDAGVGAEAVHLRQKGIEGVLPLVVAAVARVLAACTAYGVDLVDEDDARSLLLRLGKGVPHTRRAHAHEHFYKV